MEASGFEARRGATICAARRTFQAVISLVYRSATKKTDPEPLFYHARGTNGRIKLSKHHVLLSNAIPRLRPILRTDSSRSRKKEVPRKEFFNSDAQFERITPYKVLHVETP